MMRLGMMSVGRFVAVTLALSGVLSDAMLRVSVNRGTGSPRSVLPPFSGVGQNGAVAGDSNGTGCFLLRVGSRYCGHCYRDRELRDLAFDRAEACGCTVVNLAPSAAEAEPVGITSVSLTHIYFQLAESLAFPPTPTTAIVRGDGQVMWSRTGELRPRDVEEIRRSLAEYRGECGRSPHERLTP